MCFVLGADLEASLLSFEKLDRASPDLWPEQRKFIVSLYQNRCRKTSPTLREFFEDLTVAIKILILLQRKETEFCGLALRISVWGVPLWFSD